VHTPPAEVPVLLLRACKATWYIRNCILVIDSYAYSHSAQVVKIVLDVREAEQDVRVKSRILIVAASPSLVKAVGKSPRHAGFEHRCAVAITVVLELLRSRRSEFHIIPVEKGTS
jgi:hypothetical protein